ncbi:hypothetical protein IV102_10270 [bacterium]|nr:hypothetical protein [bacterium]
MRLQLVCLILFSLWGVAGADDLQGLWALESLHLGDKIIRDPRWKCSLRFEGDRFRLISTSVTEKRLVGRDGSSTTRPIEHEVFLGGSYQLDKSQLILHVQSPVTSEQTDFAQTNFGKAAADGSYRPGVLVQDQLKLRAVGRELIFVRQNHK